MPHDAGLGKRKQQQSRSSRSRTDSAATAAPSQTADSVKEAREVAGESVIEKRVTLSELLEPLIEEELEWMRGDQSVVETRSNTMVGAPMMYLEFTDKIMMSSLCRESPPCTWRVACDPILFIHAFSSTWLNFHD